MVVFHAGFDAAFVVRVEAAAAAPALAAEHGAALFFPFDPYVLPESAHHVAPTYRAWDDEAPSDSESSDGDDSSSRASSADDDDSRMPHSLSPSNMSLSRSLGAAGAAPMSLSAEPPRAPRERSATEEEVVW